MKRGRVNVIIDGQWGSTGKGKLAGWLGGRNEIAVAAAMVSPNAGHTWVGDDGHRVVLGQLPSAAITNTGAHMLLTAHCVIDPPQLLREIEELGCADRLTIHPKAAVVTPECLEEERRSLDRISSTKHGTGAALARRIMRMPDAVACMCPNLKRWVWNPEELVHQALSSGGAVLLEVSQGFDLSLTHGTEYPFVTSRDITTAAGLNALGVPPAAVGDVYGCLRTFPIRVGHAYGPDGAKIGDSGPCYPDQEEMTWEDVFKAAGLPKETLPERTTVTQKVRRAFTFSLRQFERFIRMNGPTHLFLNFVQYWDAQAAGAAVWDDLPDSVQWRVRQLQNYAQERATGAVGLAVPRFALLGTGPRDSEMVEVEN